MNLFDLIKHDKNTDVAFKIYDIKSVNDELVLKGYWINIVNPHNYYVINIDHIIITDKELPNWKVIKKYD